MFDKLHSVYAIRLVGESYFGRIGLITISACKDNITLFESIPYIHGIQILLRVQYEWRDIQKYLWEVQSTYYHQFQFQLNCANFIFLFCAKILMLGKNSKRLSHDDIKERLVFFLMNFQDPELDYEMDQAYGRLGKLKYRIIMQKIANQQVKKMEIHIQDIEQMLRKEEDKPILAQIRTNTKKFIQIFYQIVEKSLPQRNKEINPEDQLRHNLQNALQKQRAQNLMGFDQTNFAQNELVPMSMHRKFHIVIVYRNVKPSQVMAIHDLNSNLIGSLIVLKGIVIRTDQVKPRLSVATFTCDVCGSQNYVEIFNDHFHPLAQCQSKKCKENGISGKLSFIPKHSHFVPTQEIKIQQTPDQLKEGNIPRNLKLVLTETNIKVALPGDIVQIQGVLMPKRKEGYAHQQDLIFDVCIQAFKIESQKKKYVDMHITQEDVNEIQKMRAQHTQDQIFEKLYKSIAPQIYGHQYVKKALLLLLAGGVTTVTHDKLRIRGQINLMLVGDPGVAKSQLLKHISYIAPRGVYTTGKGSSDVGLTAAIKIDPITKDVSLEAGALVLADMGVCCIDQFDKMNQYDRTAIHEVMEQQTVSIAKAGITTTLNARTSVLAAANPLYSRYNPSETPQKNINLPAALLSRFDLIFILLDTIDQKKDFALAKHIGEVHKNKSSSFCNPEFSGRLLRTYIGLAKGYQPKISQQLTSLLIDRYVKKRAFYADRTKQGQRYITTRNLLALIRMCQARARLRFSNQITKEDILECEQIMLQSQKNVSVDQDRKDLVDEISSIFSIIKSICNYKTDKIVEMDVIEKRILARGFRLEDLQNTIIHYENLNVLMRNKDGTIQMIE